MWRNYLTTALRLLARNRIYAGINIGGLALGLAACLLILNYVRYESSYDAWLPDSGRIYQVQTKFNLPGQPARNVQMSPFIVYEKLPGGFAQVEAVTSLAPGKTVTERDGQPAFIDAATVDANFFDVLGLPFAQGGAATALPDTNSIVLTESEAIRHFGTADALGKQLSLGAGPGKRDYRVTGVLRDLPRNTSLRLSLLFRRDLGAIPLEQRGWSNFNQQHYVKLRRAADAASINAGLPGWEKRNILGMSDAVDLKLVPLADVHLGTTQDSALTPGGDPRALATFAVVALLTLAMAVMNFVNLSTARATQRAREVALRKVLGASRGQLIVQFLGESVVMAGVAMLFALTIVELATPWISAAIGAGIRIAYLGPAGMALESRKRPRSRISGGEQCIDAGEFLARGSFARRGIFGCLDLLPVAEGHDLDAAPGEQCVEADAPLLSRTVADIGGDLVGDGEAVGTIGADRSGRPATGPADCVESGQHTPLVIGEAAGAIVIGHAFDRRRAIADAAHHQAGGHRIALAGAVGAALGVERGTFDHDALGPAVAFDRDGHREEIEDDADRLVRAVGAAEIAQVRDRFALAGIEQRIGVEGREVDRIDDRPRALELAELAEFLGRHRDLVRAAAAEERDGVDTGALQRRERMLPTV